MAYFPNGMSGEVLEDQCDTCEHQEGCAVYGVQMFYNYSQLDTGNEMAREILNNLINGQGKCTMHIPRRAE